MIIVAGATGFCDATVTTAEENADLSTLVGKLVRLQCEVVDVYFAFVVDASTPATMDTDAAAVGTSGVPLILRAGDTMDFHVPGDRKFLRYRSITGTGGILRAVPISA